MKRKTFKAASSFKFLIGFLTVVLNSCATPPKAAFEAGGAPLTRSTTFLISPFLYSVGSGTIHLSWQYQSSVALANADIAKLTLPSGTISVTAKADKGLWTVDLPLPACGLADVSYEVAGMVGPVKIHPIPCPGSAQTAEFAMISDAQESPRFVAQLAKQIMQHPGSALLSDGDLVQHGANLPDWIDYFAAVNDVTSQRVMVPAVGNHEYRGGDTNAEMWAHFFRVRDTEAHYAFDIGDAHIIVLNSCFSDQPKLIDAQLPWLTLELAQPARWKLVMFHHPPYSSGIANSPFAPKKEYYDLQKKYVPLFEKYGVDIVLLGHTHIFERSVKSGVQYLVSGAAGGKMGMYGPKNPYSVVTKKTRTATYFTVTDQHLEARTLDIDGNQVDDLKLEKSRPALQ